MSSHNLMYASRNQAILLAREMIEKKPVYLDTETTGLDVKAEIIEIAIVDHDGTILFQSLARPINTNPSMTSHIHGITADMLNSAKSWPLLWNEIRSLLFGRFIGIYNENFDIKMIEQTNRLYNIPRPHFHTFDIMEIYAHFKGIWNDQHSSYRLFKQEAAANQCGIKVNDLHRAADDALLSRNILRYIAATQIAA